MAPLTRLDGDSKTQLLIVAAVALTSCGRSASSPETLVRHRRLPHCPVEGGIRNGRQMGFVVSSTMHRVEFAYRLSATLNSSAQSPRPILQQHSIEDIFMGRQVRSDDSSEVSVVQFLRTGLLGPGGHGLTEEAVRQLWGEPTDLRLTTPASRSYGPVMVFFRDGTVTHIGVYVEHLGSAGPPGFDFDVPVDSEGTFRRALLAAGLHAERADDEMHEGEPEVVLRVEGSGVLAFFNERGQLAGISNPMPPR
jgi:hypothetical protein